jgi:hypothetical protein
MVTTVIAMTGKKLSNVIRIVEALLQKANNTSYPEEAKAFQQKAQELMTKYQVEETDLFGRSKDEIISNRKVSLEPPYVIDKSILLGSIARQNFCRVLRGPDYAIIYGYESDIELTLVMYNYLVIDMFSKAAQSIPEGGTTTSWKKSFFGGYSSTISKRLREAKKFQIEQESIFNGNDNFALALNKKEHAILEFWESVDRIKVPTRQLNDKQGYESGISSASLVDLGQPKVGEG